MIRFDVSFDNNWEIHPRGIAGLRSDHLWAASLNLCFLSAFGARRMDNSLAEQRNQYRVAVQNLQHVNLKVHEKYKK